MVKQPAHPLIHRGSASQSKRSLTVLKHPEAMKHPQVLHMEFNPDVHIAVGMGISGNLSELREGLNQ